MVQCSPGNSFDNLPAGRIRLRGYLTISAMPTGWQLLLFPQRMPFNVAHVKGFRSSHGF